MRLINADELPVVSTIERIEGNDVFVANWIPTDSIDNAPTVEAIPVEWIRKWHGINDIKDFDLREYVKCTMLYMIKDWKNENE